MFCYQCQETAKNQGCTVSGVCGKKPTTANLQDLLLYVLKGISILSEKDDKDINETGRFVTGALFSTITNANFDDDKIITLIKEALEVRNRLRGSIDTSGLHDAVTWDPKGIEEFEAKAKEVGVLSEENEDVRSLRELAVYGTKGISAYAQHASVLG